MNGLSPALKTFAENDLIFHCPRCNAGVLVPTNTRMVLCQVCGERIQRDLVTTETLNLDKWRFEMLEVISPKGSFLNVKKFYEGKRITQFVMEAGDLE